MVILIVSLRIIKALFPRQEVFTLLFSYYVIGCNQTLAVTSDGTGVGCTACRKVMQRRDCLFSSEVSGWTRCGVSPRVQLYSSGMRWPCSFSRTLERVAFRNSMQLENINISDYFSLYFAFICIQLTNCSILYAFFPFYLYSATMLPPFNSYPEMSVVCFFFNTVLYVYDLLLNKDCPINIKSMLHVCLYLLDSICNCLFVCLLR